MVMSFGQLTNQDESAGEMPSWKKVWESWEELWNVDV